MGVGCVTVQDEDLGGGSAGPCLFKERECGAHLEAIQLFSDIGLASQCLGNWHA